MKPEWDHKNSILQISGSLYRYFGMDKGHGSDKDLDAWLIEKDPRCIITVLIDAMGTSILKKHLAEDSFLRSHMMKEVSTVFPPTTAAATTAFFTGLSPMETGWLGWQEYFPEKDDNLILFFDQGQFTSIQYEKGFVKEKLPVTRIYEALNSIGIKADTVWPAWSDHNGCESFDELLDTAKLLSRENRFLYVYWDELDTLMHKHGTKADEVHQAVCSYDEKLQAFADGLDDDTALLIIADHSQIDVRDYDLSKDEEMCALMEHLPALEPRTAAFFIKDGCHKRFEQLFHERFRDDFILLNKQEVIESHLFGEGKAHERFEELIGDYVGIAVGDLRLGWNKPAKGDHAGFVKEERMIPLILYRKN